MMREHYTYEIATSSGDGRWKVAVSRGHTFTRDPGSIARSVLETWILERRGDLPGGARVMVKGSFTLAEPAVAYVRVRIFVGHVIHPDARPVAVAYLADPASGHRASRRRGGLWRLRWEYRRHLASRRDRSARGEAA